MEIWKSCKWMFCSKLFEVFKNQHLGNICCFCCFCGFHCWTGKTHFLLKIHENPKYSEHSKSLRYGSTCNWGFETCSAWSNLNFYIYREYVHKIIFRPKNGFKSHPYVKNCLKASKIDFFFIDFSCFSSLNCKIKSIGDMKKL